MPALALIGLQWGDEGKGKMVDVLASTADVVVRCQGGSNAGHTVFVAGEKTVLHLVPSGILNPAATCVIGHGVVVDPAQVLKEIDQLSARGIQLAGRLLLADRAHVVTPMHRMLDQATEQRRGDQKIGTTGRGIGPAYADKSARLGLRMMDLLDAGRLRQRLSALFAEKEPILRELQLLDSLNPDVMINEMLVLGERLRPFITDTVAFLQDRHCAGARIFLEGAQGALLDLDLGTYPYVTSSQTNIGGLLAGSGLPASAVDEVMGIAKAYSTRVGSGPYPSELNDSVGETLRARGKEFGATTGRPRRCGWFDAVAACFAIRSSGITGIALTKLDVLSGLSEVRICVAYEYKGRRIEVFPSDTEILTECRPIYQTFRGWSDDLSGRRDEKDLPPAVLDFIGALESLVKTPVRYISVGPNREDIIRRNPAPGGNRC